MSPQLNHTIVWCHDQHASAKFLSNILGLPPARALMHFMVVSLANGVSLDFMAKNGNVAPQHYAFLVGEDDFDAALARVQAARLNYWADPARSKPREINHHGGGRGVYFEDPNHHLLELITQPYAEGQNG